MDNAANKTHVNSKEKEVKLEKINENEDMKFLLNLPQFNRFVWKTLAFCGVNESPFNTNALTMALLVGQGNVGRYLMAKINDANPEALVKLMKEVK